MQQDARAPVQGQAAEGSHDRDAAERARIRVDQCVEFVARDLDLWAYTRGVTLDFSRPGKPTDNAFIEAFSGRFRAEGLNGHWFMSLEDARQKMEALRRYYNEERPQGVGDRRPRLHCLFIMTHPTRHHDEARKL